MILKKRIITLAEHYKIPVKSFEALGVLNPSLNNNTYMFIDPVCLKTSKHKIFKNTARAAYIKHFETLYDEVKAYTKLPEDVKKYARQTLIKKIRAKELSGLCLGYSSTGKGGNGIGQDVAEKILEKAETLISLGIDKPAIFSLIHLLTDKVGPDYISDMTARIILPQILEFTVKMSMKLNIPVNSFRIEGKYYDLPFHPFTNGYVLLVPEDILNPLPIDVDLEDVFNGFNPSDEIKYKINKDIASILERYSKATERREKLSEYLLKNKKTLKSFVDYVGDLKSKPYNFKEDKKGVYFSTLFWEMVDASEQEIKEPTPTKVINEIINNFKKLLDNNNNVKRNLLWYNGKPRIEKSWQQAFHLYINELLSLNDIDITPESETGSGPVDFKFSQGSKMRVLVEIKLSKNDPEKGLERQLERYKECTENVKDAYFIYIDLEKDAQKSHKKIVELQNRRKELGLDTKIIVIDGKINPSASNLQLNLL